MRYCLLNWYHSAKSQTENPCLSKHTDKVARRRTWNQLMALFPVLLIVWLVLLERLLVPNVLLLSSLTDLGNARVEPSWSKQQQNFNLDTSE